MILKMYSVISYCHVSSIILLNNARKKYLEILLYLHSKFDNKALELIILTEIFNLLENALQPPDKLKNNDINPTVTYQLGKMIRKKILNYKEAVNSINRDEDVFLSQY